MLKDIFSKHSENCDETLLENELSKPVKDYKYQFILDHIIPFLYNISIFVLLIIYLATYDDLTVFEEIYSIILCILIPFSICCYLMAIYFAEPKLRGQLEKVLLSARQDPELSDPIRYMDN